MFIFRFAPGVWFVYLVMLLTALAGACKRQSNAENTDGPGFSPGCSNAACVYAVSLRSEAGISGQSGTTDFALKGRMRVAATSDSASSEGTQLIFHLDKMTISSGSSEDQRRYQDVKVELEQPFLCVYESGRNTGIRFAESMTVSALTIVRTLCSALQVVPGSAGADTWTTNEFDASGEYAAQYEREPGSDVIRKRKTLYMPRTAKDSLGLGLGVELAVDIEKSAGRIKIENGRIAIVENTEKLEARLEKGASIVSSADLKMELQREDGTSAVKMRQRWENLLPATRFVRAEETFVSISHQHYSFDNEKIGNLTLDQILDYLEQQGGTLAAARQSGDAEKKDALRDNGKMFVALGALLRTNPENTRVVLNRIQNGAVATTSLIDALGNTGTKEAQSALLQIADSESLPEEIRIRALRSLTWTKNATKETVQALLTVAKNHELANAMLLGLGTLCRHLAKEGKEQLSRDILEVLLRELKGAEGVEKTVRALRAISNSGHVDALKSVEPYLKHADEKIRGAAIQSIRLMTLAKVDQTIAHHLKTEQSVTTRIAAVSAAQTRKPSTLLADALTHMVFSGKDSVSRMRAVQLLAQWVSEMPQLKQVLKKVAEKDDNEGIRKVADGALAEEGAGV